MMATNLRAGSMEQLVFTLTRKETPGAEFLPFNPSAATRISLVRERKQASWTDTINSTDSSPMLAITDGAAGEVTLTPTALYWLIPPGDVEVHIEVLIAGVLYSFPSDDNEIITIK